MQTVPSLVGSGTAVAAAALGFAFAHPDGDSNSTPPATSRKRAHSEYGARPSNHSRLSSAPASSRPATSAASRLPNLDETSHNETTAVPNITPATPAANSISRPNRPPTQLTPPRAGLRRQTSSRQGEPVEVPATENVRDSVSSHGSWMRRLSIRPLSQHGSFLSSTGPDSHSIAFSYGSAAPILSPTGTAPTPLPPNKLVKRAPSAHQNPAVRRRAKSHLPTLRRPATSHQRSATLQQANLDWVQPDGLVSPKFSFDRQPLPEEPDLLSPTQAQPSQASDSTRWTSLFHSRIITVSIRGAPDRLLDRGPPPLTKRIRAFVEEKKDIYLVKGGRIGMSTSAPEEMAFIPEDSPGPEPQEQSPGSEKTNSPGDDTPTKRVRRSISTTFSSPSNLFSKAGSLRRSKRAMDLKSESKRHVSAPMSRPQEEVHGSSLEDPASPAGDAGGLPTQLRSVHGDPTNFGQPLTRQRNSSSPLPPLSRLSSFNVDLSRQGSLTAGTTSRSNPPFGASQNSVPLLLRRNSRHERSSTMNSSDLEVRGFQSGDDDDTDFKSDTMFDSLRTMGSSRNRAAESPLGSMFDESPPSTAGANSKTKRLSIQEILGRAWDSDDRIMEEDESISTPVRDRHDRRAHLNADVDTNHSRPSFERPSVDLSISNRGDPSRLSLDDDFDDDWARVDDEMGFGNHLSPPSSMNSRGVSPNLRMALVTINSNQVADVARDLKGERPRSNIFDWTESVPDKQDSEGHFPRPKTVHGKQEMDIRGGRPTNRRGLYVAHVRSQSVPVVYDPSDAAKGSSQKYGTWGLGTKGASEDWDDDFEFGGTDAGEGVDAEEDFSMRVPASIQASQPSLKQHSGQIRELSLLVNDLKRLCRHGRDLDMINGAYSSLWQEAEGIIALASPDEDELEGMDVDSSDMDFEHSTLSERVTDDDLDPALLKKLEDPFEAHDLRLAKTTVIRERPAGRRRSVFSPDDDIFGGNVDAATISSRPKTPESNINMGGHDVTDIVKSVLDAMQQRSTSNSSNGSGSTDEKVHFGTNNLKALVKRAGDLRDTLSDIIRRADQITQSPARTPRRHDREKGSPAFTRVFTPEPPSSSSPPKRVPHSRSANAGFSRGSHEASPSSGLSQRMQMMTVS